MYPLAIVSLDLIACQTKVGMLEVIGVDLEKDIFMPCVTGQLG